MNIATPSLSVKQKQLNVISNAAEDTQGIFATVRLPATREEERSRLHQRFVSWFLDADPYGVGMGTDEKYTGLGRHMCHIHYCLLVWVLTQSDIDQWFRDAYSSAFGIGVECVGNRVHVGECWDTLGWLKYCCKTGLDSCSFFGVQNV